MPKKLFLFASIAVQTKKIYTFALRLLEMQFVMFLQGLGV
jgi:hypothetical protein